MNKHSKIKILFDAGPIVNGNRSGIGYYAAALIQSLADNYPEDITLVGHYYNFLGRRHPTGLPQAPNISYRPSFLIPGKVPNLLRRLGISVPFELLVKQRGDFHLFPSYLGWPSLYKTPSTVTIHDLAYLENPEYVARQNQQDLEKFVPFGIARSAYVTTISEASKATVNRYYELSEKPTIVTYIPPVKSAKVSNELAKNIVSDMGIVQPYILFVGTLEPRKNLVNLMLAYENLPLALRDIYSLVLVGGRGWNDEAIIKTYDELKQKGLNIVQTGYVSEEQRSALYTAASVFTMSSANEGFGMPILEAMSYDIPVALSNIPVFHEVAGEAAVYFDQTNPSSIAKAISSLIESPSQQKKLVSQGRKNLARFSWDAVAQQVYHEIKLFTRNDNPKA
jgi:O-antigen biosynthesis alpha-1,3-mannosyltransferase